MLQLVVTMLQLAVAIMKPDFVSKRNFELGDLENHLI